MNMRIYWIGPERMIPNYGMANKGDELTLPESKAESFIKQGLAEPIDLAEVKRVEEESTDGC